MNRSSMKKNKFTFVGFEFYFNMLIMRIVLLCMLVPNAMHALVASCCNIKFIAACVLCGNRTTKCHCFF